MPSLRCLPTARSTPARVTSERSYRVVVRRDQGQWYGVLEGCGDLGTTAPTWDGLKKALAELVAGRDDQAAEVTLQLVVRPRSVP